MTWYFGDEEIGDDAELVGFVCRHIRGNTPFELALASGFEEYMDGNENPMDVLAKCRCGATYEDFVRDWVQRAIRDGSVGDFGVEWRDPAGNGAGSEAEDEGDSAMWYLGEDLVGECDDEFADFLTESIIEGTRYGNAIRDEFAEYLRVHRDPVDVLEECLRGATLGDFVRGWVRWSVESGDDLQFTFGATRRDCR